MGKCGICGPDKTDIQKLNKAVQKNESNPMFSTFQLEETLNLVSVPEFLHGTYVKNE